MPHESTHGSSRIATRILSITAAGALIALCGLAGCSDADDAQSAVRKAGRSFSSVAASDPSSHAQQNYLETENLVSEFIDSDDAYGEAAAVSLALAKLGQASLASQEASAAETAALQQARVIRGMISEWLTMTAIAQAAGTFDPSEEIREINRVIETRREDIQRYQELSEQIQSEIGQHESRIEELRQQADEERNLAGGLELQMPSVSAGQAAEIAQRVREHTLRADQYEFEAVRLEGMADQRRPEAQEINLNLERANSQIELLEQAAQELRDREQSSQEDEQLARQSMQDAAERIEQAVSTYTQFREDEVRSANERAISLARSALSALRDANDVTRQVASLTQASVQQTLAECYARQAAGYAEEALLYRGLQEAGLSNQWDQMIESARQAQAEARESANQAFLDAASALRSARIQGEQAEKLEATAQRLERLGGLAPEPEFQEPELDDSEDFEDEDPANEGAAEEDEDLQDEDFQDEDDG